MMKRTHTIIEEDSTIEEWNALRAKLGQLTAGQVELIAQALGIHFANNANPSKEEYIDVLDEVYWDEMAAAYESVTGSSTHL